MSSTRQPFTIKENETDSNEISVEERSFFLLEVSAAITGTAFAIHHKRVDGSFGPITDDAGVAVSITVAAGALVALTSDSVVKAMAASSAIKFVSTTAELGGDRDMFLTME